MRRSQGLRREPGFAHPAADGSAAAPVGGRMLVAAERCGTELRAVLGADGWPRLTRTQLLLFAALPPLGARPTTLARQLRVTRQALHRSARELIDHGLLVADPVFANRTGTVLRLTDEGARLVAVGRDVLLAWDAQYRDLLLS